MITKARKWIMVASLMLTMCFAINNSTSAKAAVVTEVATQNLKLNNVNAPKQGVVISSPMCVKLSENKFSGGTHERRKNNHMGRADPCLPE